jgi:Ca-activated chloride channel family protein
MVICFPPSKFSRSALLFLLLACVSALAQKTPTPSTDQVHIAPAEPGGGTVAAAGLRSQTKPLRVDVNLVLVPVSVYDAKNQPVTTLEKSDFTVFEDTVQQSIRYFSTEEQPISLGVLLDMSGSMKNKIEMARQAVVEFFKNSHPDDDYFVITFADQPDLLADSTRSIGYIQDRITVAQPQGHTALLDAIYLGISKMRRAHYKRRALLIISDGGDNHSRYTAGEIKRLVEESDVQIYAIGIFDSIFRTPEEWAGKRLLTRITSATGGRVLTIGNAARLPAAATTISRELRSQYVLGYEPQPRKQSGWRKIKVKLSPAAAARLAESASSHMSVFAKSGYLVSGN